MSEENSSTSQTFLKLVQSPMQFKLFLLRHLPMALLAGLRVQDITNHKASVRISLNYLTKNPFGSIYFACLAMAAELSTGILAMKSVEQSRINFSLLVVEIQAEFTKKAIGSITFTCDDGLKIEQTIEKCIESNNPQQVRVQSKGINEDGDIVAKFKITWSFKPKE